MKFTAAHAPVATSAHKAVSIAWCFTLNCAKHLVSFLLWFTMGPERLRAKAQTDSEATLCHLCGIVCLKAALLIRCIVFMISVSLHLLSDL